MAKIAVREAATAYRLLDGVCCIYKEAGETLGRLRTNFLNKICEDLCEMDLQPPRQFVHIEGDTTKPLTLKVFPSYVQNPLVMGPAYRPEDFRYSYVTTLGINTSGLLVIGINGGNSVGRNLTNAHPMRTYKIIGKFGEAKHNLLWTGRTVDTSKYTHIYAGNISNVLSAIQSAHQRLMFESCGVDIQSQAAYELAAAGPIRPVNKKIPIVYGIKCIDFQPPFFTLEVQSINEYEAFLASLIHDIGIKLRSVAHTTSIKCVAHSFFTIDQALLKKHWTVPLVLDNIRECNKIINKYKHLITPHIAELDNDTTSRKES